MARDSPIGVGDMDTWLYLLFGEIRRHSTVALSGEAADEVFGGYPWSQCQGTRRYGIALAAGHR
ncbi:MULTISPECIES: asparagine synthase-related protein [Streptomyces]|uniref:asparagine synthase-related protein n=1 Tax=Streptomyces TaxID=1883 RepID=UPI0002ACD886